MSDQSPVSVLLAGPDLNGFVLRQMYPVVSSDPGRFRVVNLAGDWDNFTNALATTQPELAVIAAEVAPGPDELIKVLSQTSGLAIVILPPAWAQAQGAIENCHTVSKVFIGPIANWPELFSVGHSAVVTARTRTQSAAPLQSMYAGSGNAARAGAAVVGTRVIAFVSTLGGAGRSTIAESLAYELAARRGIRTLLYSFDLPPAAVQHLKLRFTTNAGLFFSRPAAFAEAIQTREGLDVIVAPHDSYGYAQAAQQADKEPHADNSLRALVQASWVQGYAAVVLDLPAGESNWTLHPLLAANTVVVVARPTIADLYGAVHTVKLLTEHMAGQHRIPREAMYCVLNRTSNRSSLTPNAFHQEAAQASGGFFPPIVAAFEDDPSIPAVQDRQQIPAVVADNFGRNIQRLADAFYGGNGASANGRRPIRGQGLLGRFGIRVKVT